jgi:hypothetical protein
MPLPRNLLLAIAPTTGRGLWAPRRRADRVRPAGRRARPGHACAAGNLKSYAMRFDRTSTAEVSRASRHARMVIETSPPTDAPAVPTAGVLHPTRDIHARVRRCNVHVKRQKSRVERLPIRPLRTPGAQAPAPPNVELRVRRWHPRRRGRGRRGRSRGLYNPRSPGARSSVGERSLHTREVAGSKPAAPTESSDSGVTLSGVPVPNWCQNPSFREGLQPGPVLVREAHGVPVDPYTHPRLKLYCLATSAAVRRAGSRPCSASSSFAIHRARYRRGGSTSRRHITA